MMVTWLEPISLWDELRNLRNNPTELLKVILTGTGVLLIAHFVVIFRNSFATPTRG
jgi:hypothetical protein